MALLLVMVIVAASCSAGDTGLEGDNDDASDESTEEAVDSPEASSVPDDDEPVDPATPEADGLGDAEALRQVLVVYDYPPAQDQCEVDAIVDTLGVERLAEIGVTAEEPEYAEKRGRLEQEEVSRIAEEMQASCDLVAWWGTFGWVGKPRQFACISRQMTDEQLEQSASAGYREALDASLADLVAAQDACAEELIAENFVRPEGVDPVVAEFASEVASEKFVFDRIGQPCFIAGFESTISAEELEPYRQLQVGELEAPLEPAVQEEIWSYLAKVDRVATICQPHHWRLMELIFEAGVRTSSMGEDSCILHEVDYERLRATMEAYGPASWEGDPQARVVVHEGLTEVGDVMASCGLGAENLALWGDFVAWYA